jgi:hypothetical protein
MAQQFPRIDKHLKGATYGNPFEKPYANSDYNQNRPPPKGSGGGKAYVNPQTVIDQHFFEPATPNDPAFSMDESPNEQSTADPIGAIMADFQQAQKNLFNNGGK